MRRRQAPRRTTSALADGFEVLDAPPPVPTSGYVMAILGPLPGGPRPRTWFVIGLYLSDPLRDLLRPYCGCGWTTEAQTRAEDFGDAVKAMVAHAQIDHGAAEGGTLLRRF